MKTTQFLTASFAVFLLLTVQKQTLAQAYIFAGATNGVDVVAHPTGYDGTGGTLNVTVGIDPTSVNASDMEISTRNVVNTWNRLNPTTNNFAFGVIDGSEIDFESVLLHEMGHSIGLAHVNLGSQGGVSGNNTDYSNSTSGNDLTFSFNSGVDGVIGSSDDVRGDDVNLQYFNTLNDPFVIDPSGVVDSTTYSRDLADLPNGHLYAANANRDVAALLGYGNTESVMNQGSFFGEVQRELAAADVAGVRYAESGLDELAGTSDDYDLVLEYVVWDGQAGSRPDIVIDFDNNQTGFAVSQSSGQFLNSDHIAITTNSIFFNSGFNWHFNTVLAVPEPTAFAWLGLMGIAAVSRRRRVK